MKADVRQAIGSVLIVISAETPEERKLLGLVAEKRDWVISSKTSYPLAGLLEVSEVQVSPKPRESERPPW